MNWKKLLTLCMVMMLLVTGCADSNAQDTSSSTPKREEVVEQPEKTEVVMMREAADLENGKQVFLAQANCTQCHRGGINTVVADKHLGKDALEKYNMDSLEAIARQVKNGKNAMPAYGRRLSEEQIRDVAAYVLSQAEKGWTNQ